MSKQLKQKIIDIIENNPLAALATIEGDKPWVRYMVIEHDEDLICYSTSFANSRKVIQIQQNNNVHITMGGDPQHWEAPYINIQGQAYLLTDQPSKDKFWKEYLARHFAGPEDPNYIVLKFIPSVIEYREPGREELLVYTME